MRVSVEAITFELVKIGTPFLENILFKPSLSMKVTESRSNILLSYFT